MRNFKVSKWSLGFTYFINAFFVLAALYVLPSVFLRNEDTGAKLFFICWSIFVLFISFKNLSMPHTILLNADKQRLIFKSILSEKEIESKKINKIEITLISNAFIIIKYDDRKLTLLNGIDGLHELINEIKKANPDLETRGC